MVSRKTLKELTVGRIEFADLSERHDVVAVNLQREVDRTARWRVQDDELHRLYDDHVAELNREIRELRDRLSRLEGRMEEISRHSSPSPDEPSLGLTMVALQRADRNEKAKPEGALPMSGLTKRLNQIHGDGMSVEEMIKIRKMRFPEPIEQPEASAEDA